MKSMILCVFTAVFMTATLTDVMAAPESVNVEVFKTRLAELEKATQDQVAALTVQMEAAKEEGASEKLAKEAMEIKLQGEIQRLEIILEWAQAEGDEARIAEVQEALYNLVNPPPPVKLPEIQTEKNIAPSQSEQTGQ